MIVNVHIARIVIDSSTVTSSDACLQGEHLRQAVTDELRQHFTDMAHPEQVQFSPRGQRVSGGSAETLGRDIAGAMFYSNGRDALQSSEAIFQERGVTDVV